MRASRRRYKASAALVLGVLSGMLAAITVLPTIFPLTWRLVDLEDRAALHRATLSARASSALLAASSGEVDVETATAGLLGDAAVEVIGTGLPRALHGSVPPRALERRWCADEAEEARWISAEGVRWAAACHRQGERVVLVVQAQRADSSVFVGWLVLGLASMVGISTALGVLQVLQPLSAVTEAVRQLQDGQRGVSLQPTGLTELDDLVHTVNATSRAVEDREDAILGRIEVVQQLARMVAHEIRNPLQSLELLSANIADEDDRAERTELAAIIRGEIRTLEDVVARLLRDAPGHAALRPNRQDVDVREIVQHAVAFRRPEARRKDVSLAIVAPAPVPASVDRNLLIRVLENLIANAIRATPEGGRVVVEVTGRDGAVVLSVDDDGPGVPDHQLPTLFQLGNPSRKNGHGIGLGLVSGVVQAHGGEVRYERSPLGGARFVCQFADHVAVKEP